MPLAPIALFVYNRPEHTRLTIAALRANALAQDTDLIIFADGAKNAESEFRVQAVRRVVRDTTGFRSVTIHESPVNKGLAQSIIDGVSQVCDARERVIVLEDDFVTSPWFLKYMNDALAMYASDDRVISVAGYSLPVRAPIPETFFLRGGECWGWATWKRAWKLFERDGAKLLKQLRSQQLTHRFDLDGAYPYTRMLEQQVAGKNDSWAIRWHATAFLLDRLTLYPGRSLIGHIGHDGTGTHGDHTDAFATRIASSPIEVTRIAIEESAEGREARATFLREYRGHLPGRAVRFLRRTLRRLRAS